MEYVLAMGSVHKALKAESVLNDADVAMRLIPAPKALAKFCDLVIRIKDEDTLKAALEALAAKGAPPKAVYRREGDDYIEVVIN